MKILMPTGCMFGTRDIAPVKRLLIGIVILSISGLAFAQSEDTSPPVLTAVSVTPDQVDTLMSAQAVQVTRVATDNLSGVAYNGAGCTGFTSGLVFSSPSGLQTVRVNNCAFTLSSGTAQNGEFTASAIFPRYSESGIWALVSTILQDQAGNTITLNASNLASLGISATVEVTSPGDTTAPTPTAVVVSALQIDTSLSSQAVQVTRSVVDDLSGVAYQGAGCTGFTTGLVFVSPSGVQQVRINNCAFTLSSGSSLDGEFTGTAVFPQFAEIGIWNLQSMILEDRAKNNVTLGQSQLAALGISAAVEVVSPGDVLPPELISISVYPEVIDTSQSAKSVQVVRSLTDDISGVAYMGAGCTGYTDGLVFTSPTGIQTVKINNCQFSLQSGTEFEGDFVGAAHFPQFSEAGIWRLTNVIIEDKAGNSRFLGLTELAALGIEVYVEVGQSAPSSSCQGFQSPMASYPVKAKKNRVFPLKFELYDEAGFELNDLDVAAAPVVQVLFTSGSGVPIDVTASALSSGAGSEGNQFEYVDEGHWQFNLKSSNYTAEGEYLVTAVSGDDSEYTIDPACMTSFVIEN